MPAPLNIGVIGLGRMGQLYARTLGTQVSGVILYAIADVNEQARARLTESFGLPRAVSSALEMISLPELDAVVIATPTSTHCDLVIAAESAKFNQAFIKIGLTPDCGGTFILPRLVGWKKATELLFTGDLISAQAAAEMGMINSVTPDEELMSRAMAMAENLAHAPTAAIAEIKKLLDASAANDLRSQLDLERKTQIDSGKTKDFVEGVSAFLEKRPPRFVGG